jgi:hypothetical protein
MQVKYHGIVHTVKEKTSQALQATVSTVDAVYKVGSNIDTFITHYQFMPGLWLLIVELFMCADS